MVRTYPFDHWWIDGFLQGVSILAIIHSKTNAFLPSVVIIEQYRPCVDKVVIGTSMHTVCESIRLLLHVKSFLRVRSVGNNTVSF